MILIMYNIIYNWCIITYKINNVYIIVLLKD